MKASQARSSKHKRMGRPVDKHRRGTLRSTVELMATAILLVAGWIGLVAGTKPHEMLVGVGVVALLTPFAASLLRSDWLRFSFRLGDLLQCWRIPWYVLSGCWEITVLLLRDLFAGRRTGSYYRACSFRINKRDPVLIARSVLAVAYTTMAPNFIVIGIDTQQRQMLFHQVERSSVPKMSQALGAQMELQP
jgi:hypothetical protein